MGLCYLQTSVERQGVLSMNVLLASGLDSFLGTVWFILLVGSVSFIAGVWMSDRVKSMLGR